MSEYKGCPEYSVCRELRERVAELSPRAHLEFRCDDCNSYRCYCDGYLQGFTDALRDGYKSPIESYTTDFCNRIIEESENAIVAEISEQIGLNIDKEELLKALAYDRDQYRKGYADALLMCGSPQFEWIPVSKRLPDDREDTYWVCTDGGYQCQCRWTNVNQFWTDLKTDWHWCPFDIPQYQKVVAWEILPEVYKEGEE